MNNLGIDYGNGLTNIDHETGIRYGVISQNEVLQVWADSSEPEYGPPTCGHCGEELPEEYAGIDNREEIHCPHCNEIILGTEDMYPETPIAYIIDDSEYIANADEMGDIMIVKSPYYTYASFCSPCAPGAGYLMDWFKIHDHDKEIFDGLLKNDCNQLAGKMLSRLAENTGFPKVYCFGHDWFDSQETGKWIDCQYCNGTGYRQNDSIPNYKEREKELIASGFIVPFDDNRFVCNVCGENHQSGQIGKIKEMINKTPYPVFSVETGELIEA